MPSAADYFMGAGRGLGELSGALYDIQDRKEKDLEKRSDYAKGQTLADPLIRKSIERIINGEDPEQVAHEHLVEQHLASQQRQPASGPWKAGYDKGPDQSPMIPYSQPATGSRLPSGPLASLQPAGSSDPGIQNQDVGPLMKLGGMLQDERRNNAMADYRNANLGLGYDKLDAQMQKDAMMQEYRQASADYMRAKAANMPEQMALARRRADIAAANLGMRGQELGLGQQRQNFNENKEYLKNTTETAWTIPAIDNILMKARGTPGMVPPPEDYTKRRTAEMLSKIPLVGGMASSIMTRSADQDLTQAQRDFRRQVQLAITPFRKLIVGSQITEGEMGIINELAGGQLSIEDTIAGLAALRQLMMSRQSRTGQAFPGAAQRIGSPNPAQTLPPLSNGIPNDPYGLGALQENPELDYFRQFGYQGGP